jgi:phage shock protein A
MSIFRRLFKIGQAESNNLIDKLEDPIKMTEQGIRDLKSDLTESMKALAELKALAIRMERDKNTNTEQAEDWEKKAVLLLQSAKNGKMDIAEAERLAKDALLKKEDVLKKAAECKISLEKQNDLIGKMTIKIEQLKRRVESTESDLKTLKARARTAEATLKINKQLSNIDSDSTINMLERMKQRIDEDESLAEAYENMDDIGASLEDEINKVLDKDAGKGDDLLADLKSKLK